MAGETKPYDDRELARRVVERGNHRRAIPGTYGHSQLLKPGEIEYLRWLYGKTRRDVEPAA